MVFKLTDFQVKIILKPQLELSKMYFKEWKFSGLLAANFEIFRGSKILLSIITVDHIGCRPYPKSSFPICAFAVKNWTELGHTIFAFFDIFTIKTLISLSNCTNFNIFAIYTKFLIECYPNCAVFKIRVLLESLALTEVHLCMSL